eukprot:6697012-Prymnesium_polylepis.1
MAGDCAALSACGGERQRRGVYHCADCGVASKKLGQRLSFCPRTTGSRDIVPRALAALACEIMLVVSTAATRSAACGCS